MAKKDVKNDKKKNNFSKELRAEMKKVTWPTFKQLVSSTSAVISIVLIVAVIVFVLDVCFENLNKVGVEHLKSVVSSNTEESVEDTEGEGIEGDILDSNIELITEEDVGEGADDVLEETLQPEVTSTTETEQDSTEEVVQ